MYSCVRASYICMYQMLLNHMYVHQKKVLLSELIKTWGDARFESFVREGQQLYRRRAEAACRAAKEHLEGLAEYIVPRAGMFMWLKFTGDCST